VIGRRLLTPWLRALFKARRIFFGSRPRSVQGVGSSSIRFPSRHAGSEVAIGIGQSAVMLFFEFICRRSRVWIAALPEGHDRVVPLLVSRKLLEVCPLLVGNNPRNIFREPFFVNLFDRRIRPALGRLPRRIAILSVGGECQKTHGPKKQAQADSISMRQFLCLRTGDLHAKPWGAPAQATDGLGSQKGPRRISA
jgi:hypothetical protein